MSQLTSMSTEMTARPRSCARLRPMFLGACARLGKGLGVRLGAVCLGGLGLLGSVSCGKADDGGSGSPNLDTTSATSTASTAGATSTASTSGGIFDPAPSSGLSTVAEFCDAYPTALAEYRVQCHGGTVEDWLAALELNCELAKLSEAAGRISLDVEQADRCLFTLTQGDCRTIVCLEVIQGGIPSEGTCNDLAMGSLGDECEDGFYCPDISRTCVSSCQPALSEGESCAGAYNTTPCLWPRECGSDARCTIPAGEGEPCETRGDCQWDLYCAIDSQDPEQGGTCQRARTEPCEGGSECAAGYQCVGEEGNKSCLPGKRVGDPCTMGLRECPGQCSLEGVCELASGEGEPCGVHENQSVDGSETLRCEAGLTCDSDTSTCKPKPDASCTDLDFDQ